MLRKTRSIRDAFTFSLGGLATIASFVTVPVVADDRINKAIDQRLRQSRENDVNQLCNDFGDKPHPWFDHSGQTDLRDCV